MSVVIETFVNKYNVYRPMMDDLIAQHGESVVIQAIYSDQVKNAESLLWSLLLYFSPQLDVNNNPLTELDRVIESADNLIDELEWTIHAQDITVKHLLSVLDAIVKDAASDCDCPINVTEAYRALSIYAGYRSTGDE